MKSSEYKSFLDMSAEEIDEMVREHISVQESRRMPIYLEGTTPVAGYEVGDRVYDVFTSRHGTVDCIREVAFEVVYAYVLWDGDDEPRIQPKVPNVKKVSE